MIDARQPTEEERRARQPMRRQAIGRVSPRAHLIRLSAQHHPGPAWALLLTMSRATVRVWLRRCNAHGPAGLYDEFVTKYPVATKRVLRAFLKATDLCAQAPEHAASMLAAKGYEPRYDVAMEVLKSLPYNRWREAHPEDTLRFHALRLHEVGMLKSTPQQIIAQGTDWRFLNELKQELKG